MKLMFLILFQLFLTTRTIGFGVNNILNAAIDTGRGVIESIPDAIPNFEELKSLGKNVIAGYPFETAFKLVNAFCAAALSKNQVKTQVEPNLGEMNFLLFSKDQNYSIPLTDAAKLWEHPAFNRDYDVEIFVLGWTTNYNESNEALNIMRNAFLCRKNVNFIAIDTSNYVDTLYSWSALNTEAIGNAVALGLRELVKFYPLEKIHLTGHSLGAHIVGAAARNFSLETNKLIRRVTGLDPANPCFNEGAKLTGLSRGDAEFVDIIHSNPGALGKRDPIGDVDFYPNGLEPLPHGCLTIVCAHAMAWRYYAESVYPGNEKGFMGVKCTSLSALNNGYCSGKPFPMGYNVPFNLKGNYFLNTAKESPYGIYSKYTSEIVCNN